jgi:hypothetical protein
MIASSRVLNAILDHILQLLPDEPADSKRLDDIVDADASVPNAEPRESMLDRSGVHSKLHAAS